MMAATEGVDLALEYGKYIVNEPRSGNVNFAILWQYDKNKNPFNLLIVPHYTGIHVLGAATVRAYQRTLPVYPAMSPNLMELLDHQVSELPPTVFCGDTAVQAYCKYVDSTAGIGVDEQGAYFYSINSNPATEYVQVGSLHFIFSNNFKVIAKYIDKILRNGDSATEVIPVPVAPVYI